MGKKMTWRSLASNITAAALATAGCGLVGPSGTQSWIRGEVTDRAGRAIAGALVQVLDGPIAGTTRLSDARGRFELTSPSALSGTSVTVRASREGIETRTTTAPWQSEDAMTGPVSFHFWVDTLEPPIGLEPGEYTLSVAIDLAAATDHPFAPQAPCSGFPEALAARHYRASITTGRYPQLYMFDRLVNADNPSLLSRQLFSFSVAGPFVRFDMEEEGIFEEVSAFRYLDIQGTSLATEPANAVESSISLPFKAYFTYCELNSPRGTYPFCGAVPRERLVAHHTCVSDRGTMVFTRR